MRSYRKVRNEQSMSARRRSKLIVWHFNRRKIHKQLKELRIIFTQENIKHFNVHCEVNNQKKKKHKILIEISKLCEYFVWFIFALVMHNKWLNFNYFFLRFLILWIEGNSFSTNICVWVNANICKKNSFAKLLLNAIFIVTYFELEKEKQLHCNVQERSDKKNERKIIFRA